MNKKEESSVKLDLGAEEESAEEEEDEEEEGEEGEESQESEEAIEEDNDEEDDDQLVDLDFGDENNNVILGNDPLNNPDQSSGQGGSNPSQANQDNIHAEGGITTQKKKAVAGGKDKKNNATLKKLLGSSTGDSPQKKRIENSEKTVFTRISEELFNKFISNKDVQNKRTSAYDFLINDMFLNRIVEKNDKETIAKFNDFVTRNKEFRDKKSLKLQERSEKITAEVNAQCTHKPNGKHFDKNEVRDPVEYLQDQLKYYQTRDLNIKQQQEDIKKSTDANLKKAPEISKKSKKLAKKKHAEGNSKAVHERLAQEKLHKAKKFVYEEKEEEGKKGKGKNKKSYKNRHSLPLKKSKEEIAQLVNKLFGEAEERKEKKQKVQKDKIKLKEVYKMYDSDDELTTNSSKQIILEKFVQGYELALNKLFNKKDSLLINFEEFCSLMFNLALVRYDHGVEKVEDSRMHAGSNINVNVNNVNIDSNVIHEEQGEDQEHKEEKENVENVNEDRDRERVIPTTEENNVNTNINTNTNVNEENINMNHNSSPSVTIVKNDINTADNKNSIMSMTLTKKSNSNSIINPNTTINKQKSSTYNDSFKKEKELNLLKDAWKILSNINANDEQVHDERIDTNQLLVFCAGLLGLYKGEDAYTSNNNNGNNSQNNEEKVERKNTEVNNEQKHELVVATHPTQDVTTTNNETSPNVNNINTNPSTIQHQKNFSTMVSSPKKGKRVKIPNRFSTPMERHTFSSMYGSSFGSFSLTATNQKSKKIDFTQLEKENKNLLKIVVPELDMSRYHYLKNTVRQIKILFRYMYDNRVNFLIEQKKKAKMDKLNSYTNKELMFRHTIRPSENFRQSAENFRKRVMDEVEGEMYRKQESNNDNEHSPSHFDEKVKRKLRLDEVYEVLRKKKENEIAKLRSEKEEEELKHCTFQPNIHLRGSPKSVNETISKLYQDGVNKQKFKNSLEEKKQPEQITHDCTFSPKINSFNTHVFEVNPLVHDKVIEKEVKRLEKARIERRISEFQKKKGINNLKQFKNLDALLLDDELPQWNFGIEKKTYKDTIDIMNRPERRTRSTVTRADFNKTLKNKSIRNQREPLLNIEVNIDDNNTVEKLEIYSTDNPMTVAENFCRKYGLSEDKKVRLQKIIEEKLNENLGSTSNRS